MCYVLCHNDCVGCCIFCGVVLNSYAMLLLVVSGSPQKADHADWRLQIVVSTFFLILVFACTFNLHIFGSSHKLVFSYISECLFMQRPRYVTLAWYVTVDVLYTLHGKLHLVLNMLK